MSAAEEKKGERESVNASYAVRDRRSLLFLACGEEGKMALMIRAILLL